MTPIHRSRHLLASVCALAMAGSSLLHASDTSDALKALQSAIETEAASAKPAESGDDRYGRSKTEMSMMFLTQIRSALTSGDTRQIEELLNQIGMYLKSDHVRAAADKLRSVIATEKAAREVAFNKQLEEALASAAKAVKEARKPADLDETLAQLGKLQDARPDERYSRNEKARSARQFVIRWQDYLSNLVAGNTQEALQNLRNLSNETYSSVDLIPRSEILARITELSAPKPAEPTASKPDTADTKSSTASTPVSLKTTEQQIREILDNTKSLEDLSSAIDALHTLQNQRTSNNGNWNPLSAMVKELTTISQGYNEYKAGLPTQFDVRVRQGSYGNPYDTEAYNNALPLRSQLVKLLAIQSLKVGDQLQPTKDEPLDKYLDRVLESAKQQFDIALMKRVLDFQGRLGSSTGQAIFLLNVLFAAQNQEAAKQFVPAVVSYQNALKTGGDLIPAKGIGERLEAIKKDHPQDYEDGMKWFLTPVQSVQMMNSNFAMPPGRPIPPVQPAPGSAPSSSAAPQPHP